MNRQMPKCGMLRKTTPAHLIVPADDELQFAHELPEGFVLREERLCTRGDVFLLLEVQILDFSQDCHQLKGRARAGKRSAGDPSHGPRCCWLFTARELEGGWEVVLAGRIWLSSLY